MIVGSQSRTVVIVVVDMSYQARIGLCGNPDAQIKSSHFQNIVPLRYMKNWRNDSSEVGFLRCDKEESVVNVPTGIKKSSTPSSLLRVMEVWRVLEAVPEQPSALGKSRP